MAVPAFAPPSDPATHSAVDRFCCQAKELPGVLAIVRLADAAVRVHVADRRGPVGDAVRDLEERINSHSPDQFVDVWLSEAPPAGP